MYVMSMLCIPHLRREVDRAEEELVAAGERRRLLSQVHLERLWTQDRKVLPNVAKPLLSVAVLQVLQVLQVPLPTCMSSRSSFDVKGSSAPTPPRMVVYSSTSLQPGPSETLTWYCKLHDLRRGADLIAFFFNATKSLKAPFFVAAYL